MALNDKIISDRIIGSKVGGSESETALLVRLIVRQVINALHREAIVITSVNGTVSTPAGPGTIISAKGKGEII